MFPFDPEDRFGPWIFYIFVAASWHSTAQAALAGLGLIFRRAQTLLLTLGTSLAMCSGAGFAISFAWGSDMEFEESFDIAYRLCLAATIAGPVLFAYALARWRALFDEMASPAWAALTNIGGCCTFVCIFALPYVTDERMLMILVMAMLFFLTMYWSPVFLLPWKLLTRMDPMNFMGRVLFVALALSVAGTPAQAAEPIAAKIDGHMLTLEFPAGTLPGSVWLQLDGRDVPRRLAQGRRAPVRWASDTALSVDLHRVKRKIGTRWVSSARIWGQTADGAALLQEVALPGHKAHSAACGCK